MFSRFIPASLKSKYLCLLKRYWYLVVPLALGFFLNLVTAVLRVKTFIPYPKLLDFSAFYTAALALRSGLSPYAMPADWVQQIRITQAIPFTPPTIYNPPVWPWLLQPLTLFNFPTAAWLWLGLNLALLVWIAFALTQLAGYQGNKALAVILFLTITFGPVFLDLTLGQTSVILLAATLFIGYSLRPTARPTAWQAGIAEGIATGAKLFPLIWLGAAILLRRWKLVSYGAILALIALGIGAFLTPDAHQDYWSQFLVQRISTASEQASMDDQSLGAWLDRMGREHTYHVPGLNTGEQTAITWTPPWSLNLHWLRWGGYFLAGILALPIVIRLLQISPAQAEVGFYLWVLYTLVIFPHIERYNHALLLPSIAWLWGQGNRSKLFAAGAYLLAGLSRLNHVWITLLPAPWGPVASGFGLFAALLLGGGLYISLTPSFSKSLK